ncbi:MAG: NAD(P)H-hydrate dehydratase [Candidatus Kinetoplastibacterium crithidii]|nr:MAG: NAD(P)H-hydrate dehydratase [Candidatus Kinetoplastibacterium crithidii]
MNNISSKEIIIKYVEPKNLQSILKKREKNSHKGDFGTISIIGGNRGMEGSVLLAARTAIKIGSGKVLIGFTQENIPITVDLIQPELMLQTASQILKYFLTKIDIWIIGCGMGQNNISNIILHKALYCIKNKIIVIDADAINIIAKQNKIFKNSSNTIIMTPHPSEAARLLKCTTKEIQINRIKSARRISEIYKSWTVLKGFETIISSPNGNILINTSGNPGLASAGTGDVLAGMIGSFLGQTDDIQQAISGAVWLHGKAAEYLATINKGPIGMTASELAEAAREILNQYIYKN